MFNKKNKKEVVSNLPLTKKEIKKRSFGWFMVMSLGIILVVPTFGISTILFIWGAGKHERYQKLKKLFPNTISRIIISDVGSKGDFSRETEMYAMHNQGEIIKLIEAKEVTNSFGKYYNYVNALDDIGASKPLTMTQSEFNKLIGQNSFNLK